jgi:hypothetical protein
MIPDPCPLSACLSSDLTILYHPYLACRATARRRLIQERLRSQDVLKYLFKLDRKK